MQRGLGDRKAVHSLQVFGYRVKRSYASSFLASTTFGAQYRLPLKNFRQNLPTLQRGLYAIAQLLVRVFFVATQGPRDLFGVTFQKVASVRQTP